MKRYCYFLVVLLTTATALGQSRSAGQMVVPIGYENVDSLRFGIWGVDEGREWNIGGGSGINPPADSLMNLYLDTVGCTFQYNWEGWYNFNPLGKRKGVMGNYDPLPQVFQTGGFFKQRIFLALPSPQPAPMSTNYFWRYNAAVSDNAVTSHVRNNNYDANDISPYTEYDANDGIVNSTFHTLRYNNVDSIVNYGNEGRVIVACNDERVFNWLETPTFTPLSWTIPNSTYPYWIPAYWWRGQSNNNGDTNARHDTTIYTEIVDQRLSAYPTLSAYRQHVKAMASWVDTLHMVIAALGPIADTAHMFSTTFEFAIDTTSIDMALANGRPIDNLPLIRFQVLYKMGDSTAHSGWQVLPFVPFKDATHPSNPGWWKVIDTTITLAIYRSLDDDWRKEDRMANGSASHSWHFKQLHLNLQNVPTVMTSNIQSTTVTQSNNWYNYNDGENINRKLDSVFTQYVHPDSLVAYGTDVSPTGSPKQQHLLEARVLSTYRATVFLRSMSYQDTVVDKFMYRKHFGTGDSTHSLNPNGAYGGFDDSVRIELASMHSALATMNHLPFELLFNDIGGPSVQLSGELNSPMFGYLDWIASAYNIHSHWRPQDGQGINTLLYRRAGISFNGVPPSIFEIQTSLDINSSLPADYVVNGGWTDFSGTSWLDTANRRLGYFFCPPSINPSTDDSLSSIFPNDTLRPYHFYGMLHNGFPYLEFLRHSVHSAHDHPADRRMAIDFSLQGWAFNNTVFHWDTVVDRVDSFTNPGTFLGERTVRNDSLTVVNGVNNSHWMQLFAHSDTTHYTSTKTIHNYEKLRRYSNKQSHWSYCLATPEEITGYFYGAIADGASVINNAQPFEAGDPTTVANLPAGGDTLGGGCLALWGNQKVSIYDSLWDPVNNHWVIGRLDHSTNFGHQHTAWRGNPLGEWTIRDTNDANGDLPYYYVGYSNTWRAHKRAVDRINEIYDSTDGRRTPHPLRYMTWVSAYANNMADTPSVRTGAASVTGGDLPFGPEDSATKAASFLKVIKAQKVKRWSRNTSGGYIDSVGLDSLDRDSSSYVEVGIFLDSLGTSQKNYAAMIVNTRCWPGIDDTGYYNAGLPLSQRRKPTLGDIDVRKVYMKIDWTQFPSSFQNQYYVVRDLWHPDSTWLVQKDSTFAVYIKPGDAKFLYFEKGIAVNVAARSGTDTGQSTQAEFCFNNGRRVVERMHNMQDVITYTRNHHVYVAFPAKGSTFSASPDQSSGDNIITGFEQAIDTTHYCSRPSIAVAMNDTGVALTYWYKDADSIGRIAAAYQKAPGQAWTIMPVVTSDTSQDIYHDTTVDYSFVTPVITPINDTSWLIAAGRHHIATTDPLPAGIYGMVLVTPHTGSPHITFTSGPPLISDLTRGGGGTAYALFPSLASRRMWFSIFNVHMVWQQDTIAGHNHIYFTRFGNLPTMPAVVDRTVNVSRGLGSCDNLHPSLSLNGTFEQSSWLFGSVGGHGVFGPDSFYHDMVGWDAKINLNVTFGWPPYQPTVRFRVEGFWPKQDTAYWGAYSVFKAASNGLSPFPSFHYPQVAAEYRRWDGSFASPSDLSHDFYRVIYGEQLGGKPTMMTESWTPNWYISQITEAGAYPSLAQSTDPGPWTDSGAVERSIAWVGNTGGSTQPVRVTNAYLPLIKMLKISPNVNLRVPGMEMYCDTIVVDTVVSINVENKLSVERASLPLASVNWQPISPSNGGPYGLWSNPEEIQDVQVSEPFQIQGNDSIIIARGSTSSGLSKIQDSLKSPTDYVMFRMTLNRSVDSSYIGTIDSMIIKKTSVRWAGITPGFNTDTAFYKVPSAITSDTAFVALEVLRGDTTNSIERYYIDIIDTNYTPPPATYSRGRPAKKTPPPDTTKPSQTDTLSPRTPTTQSDTVATRWLPTHSDTTLSIAMTQPLVLTVHPNPTSGIALICVAELPEGVATTLQIYDANDRLVATLYDAIPESNLGLCYRFNCSNLPSSTYYARLQNTIMGTMARIQVIK